MIAYRVFPHLQGAPRGNPGHPLYVHPDQGNGRWDNPDVYRAMYLTASPTVAIGETFAHLSNWTPMMLPFPTVPGGHRALGHYHLDEDLEPLLNLDDARTLLDRGLRPTDIVVRNRPRTQDIAKKVHAERRWGGISWWSMHRPQWVLHVIWDMSSLEVRAIEPIAGHSGLREAADLLGKALHPDLR